MLDAWLLAAAIAAAPPATPAPAVEEPDEQVMVLPQPVHGAPTGWDLHHEDNLRRFKALAERGFAAYDKNHDRRFDGRDWILMGPAERAGFGLWADEVRGYSTAAAAGLAVPTWYEKPGRLPDVARRGTAAGMAKRLAAYYQLPAHRTIDVFTGLNLYVEPWQFAPVLLGYTTSPPTFDFDAATLKQRWSEGLPAGEAPFELHVYRGRSQEARGRAEPPTQDFALRFGPRTGPVRLGMMADRAGELRAVDPGAKLEFVAIYAHEARPEDGRWLDTCGGALLRVLDPRLSAEDATRLVHGLRSPTPVPTLQARARQLEVGPALVYFRHTWEGARLEVCPKAEGHRAMTSQQRYELDLSS